MSGVSKNGMLLNTAKTKIMIITTRQKRRHIDDVDLEITTGHKILGINIDANLTWSDHFHFVCKKVSTCVWLLSKISSYLNYEYTVMFYNAHIQPHFNYCNAVWGNSSNYSLSR